MVVWHAGAEVGQGTHTVMAQMAAGALGVPFERVTMITSDSARMGNPGSASASRMTFMAGNAIKGAAAEALAKWNAEERPAVAEYTYLAPKTTPFDKETGYSVPNSVLCLCRPGGRGGSGPGNRFHQGPASCLSQ